MRLVVQIGEIDADRVRQVAESALSDTIASVDVVHGGNSSRNFHVCLQRGGSYLVKFATSTMIAKFVELAKGDYRGLMPSVRYADANEGVCVMDWIDGVCVRPEELTDMQIVELFNAYERLSTAIQSIPRELVAIPVIENDTGLDLKVIHGDLNYRNVMFTSGGVKFIDMETPRYGLPTEDLSRYVVHAMERTRCWQITRLRRLVGVFSRMVALSAYTEDEWFAAIRLYERRKLYRRMRKASFSLIAKIDHLVRSPMYRLLESLVRKVKS